MGVHPDRHATGPARDIATQKFAEMKRVYDILMDPTQRQIYDAYGEKGVESGLNIGSLLKTPAEVRAEFLKQHYASQLQVSRHPLLHSQRISPSRFPRAMRSLANVLSCLLQELEDSINVQGSTELCIDVRDRKQRLRPLLRRMTMSQTMDLPTLAGHMFAVTVAASSKEKNKRSSVSSQLTEREDAHAWQLQWSCARPDDIVLSSTCNSRSVTASLQQRLSPYAQGSLSCTASVSGTPSSLVMRLDRSLPRHCACSIGLLLPSTLLPEARWAFTARALGVNQSDKDKDKDKDAGQPAAAEHRLILAAKAHLSSVTLGASASAKFKATPTDHFSLGVSADVTQEHVVSAFVAIKTNFGKRTQAGMKFSVNAGGVVITPWVSRLKQKLHLPLSIAFAPTIASSLLFTVVPLALSALILRFIELPRRVRMDSQVCTYTYVYVCVYPTLRLLVRLFHVAGQGQRARRELRSH
jgi:hypothetical protein